MIFNQDCLTLIIEELYNNKNNSLFSCLLVNRNWCKTVIPILWRNPWILLNINNNQNFLKNAKLLLNIILLHLSEESKNYLKNQGIDIFLTLNYKQKNLLFDYLNFFRYIKHRNFINGNNIYEKVFYNYNNNQRNLIMQEIYKIFMSKQQYKIKFLDISGISLPFYKYPGAEIRLLEIHELHCKSDDDPNLFNGLSKICKLIQKFFIIYSNSNDELAKLIELQYKVKYIKIIYISDDNDDDNNNNMNDRLLIDQAIMKHSKTIIYLDLMIEKNLNFINDLFSKLFNLKKLILHGSLFYRLDLNEYFISSFHPINLQILQLCSLKFSTIIKIIQNTESNLQVIWLDSNKYDNINQPGQLINIISQHCPSLKYLKIFLKDRYLHNFKDLLINCSLLEGIIIYTDNLFLNYFGDELLNILINFTPMNLHKLDLNFCKFKFESFISFLNNWKNRKELLKNSIPIKVIILLMIIKKL
ncbi:hypothetical protein C1645_820095 [Glomus cerebriforme]|uniref:F-box domain-containing protein n=1 Tax=Glomus cerebriforme TaxID=658196 RepID=A0A397T3C4_9GLOM|nr:hypothetical protein C1645_820095 [Glomus cerebriforme]